MPEGKLVLSEKATVMFELMSALELGGEYNGIVARLTDYGAFVTLQDEDGKPNGTEVGRRQACQRHFRRDIVLPQPTRCCGELALSFGSLLRPQLADGELVLAPSTSCQPRTSQPLPTFVS